MKRGVATLSVVLLVFSMLAANVTPLAAQSAGKKKAPAKAEPQLTLEAISREPGKWGGTAPTQIRWSEDGTKLYFQWNPERADRTEQYELAVNSPGATPRKVADDDKRWLSSNPGERNKAETLKLYVFQGDVYLHDLRTGKTRQVTMTSDPESNARFSFDEKGILFTRTDNLYEWVIETGETRQWTDFRKGKDPDEKPKLSKQDEYLEKEQLDLFEFLKKQEKDDKEQKERTKRERGPFPDATYLKETESVSGMQLSPDRSLVTFILTDRADANKVKVPEMPKYVTKSGYVETERLGTQIGGAGRVKVGAAQSVQKLGIMNVADGKIRYVDMGMEKREFGFQLVGGEPAPFFGGNQAVSWSPDGKNAFCVLRARDNNDRWILLLDVAGAKARKIDAEHDDAWIQSQGPYGWLADSQTIWFRSERDGYFHIYSLSIAEGSKPAQLTSGKWEVTGVQISRDKSKFYLTTSETHPGERHFYSMPVSGGARTRITVGDGVDDVTLSPDEKWLAVSFTNTEGPAELFRMENKPGAAMTRLTESYTDEFKSFRWRKFELVTIPDSDGHPLYARLYRPDIPHPAHPAVIYVHGAGYAQSVFRNWGGFGTTPFFNFLLQNGYTVLDLDYRGSAGYGRDCRTDIYRNMGGKDIDSAVAAAKWLAATQGVDARRIGIYGGSYGGFFTLMALFKHPGVFAAGAAMYPVTDWAHYNHPYTSNILNLPYEDYEAYHKSSPIYFADGLKDRLLILHGMFDRNVNYQDTVRLVQRLIELKKTGWSLATMPVEDHGWRNEYSRLDSNRRIFDLFEEVLKRPLPAGSKMTAKGK
ncbi:MAG TPA: prolyl oligopeptidase family serine peptidase [Candidatus Acidoferrales bacterium]|nr:prolyl oligopeptidase family serine peptidase [Candidatus Acidoferrales bacterium]